MHGPRRTLHGKALLTPFMALTQDAQRTGGVSVLGGVQCVGVALREVVQRR